MGMRGMLARFCACMRRSRPLEYHSLSGYFLGLSDCFVRLARACARAWPLRGKRRVLACICMHVAAYVTCALRACIGCMRGGTHAVLCAFCSVTCAWPRWQQGSVLRGVAWQACARCACRQLAGWCRSLSISFIHHSDPLVPLLVIKLLLLPPSPRLNEPFSTVSSFSCVFDLSVCAYCVVYVVLRCVRGVTGLYFAFAAVRHCVQRTAAARRIGCLPGAASVINYQSAFVPAEHLLARNFYTRRRSAAHLCLFARRRLRARGLLPGATHALRWPLPYCCPHARYPPITITNICLYVMKKRRKKKTFGSDIILTYARAFPHAPVPLTSHHIAGCVTLYFLVLCLLYYATRGWRVAAILCRDAHAAARTAAAPCRRAAFHARAAGGAAACPLPAFYACPSLLLCFPFPHWPSPYLVAALCAFFLPFTFYTHPLPFTLYLPYALLYACFLYY